MMRPTFLATVMMMTAAMLAGCDRSDGQGDGQGGANQQRAQGQGGRQPLKYRAPPNAMQSRMKAAAQGGALKGQKAPGRKNGAAASRLFSRSDAGKASLFIDARGSAVVELLEQDGKTARPVEAKKLEIWIRGMGAEAVLGGLLPQKDAKERAPGGGKAPAEGQIPAEGQAPAEDQAPAEAQAPAEEQAPAEAQAPAEEQAPAEAQAPAEEQAPAEAQAAAEGDKSGEVKKSFRFRSRPGLLKLGSELTIDVIDKSGTEVVAYRFRVPADYRPM